MSKILILRGIPASGKSTFALQFVEENPDLHARVNRDDLRKSVFGKYTDLSPDQEDLITELERNAVKTLLNSGKDVVIDSMSVRPRYVREWMKFAARNNVEAVIKEFPISLDDAIFRDSVREKSVGAQVIRNIWNKYTNNGKFLKVEYTPNLDRDALEVYVPDKSKPKAIIIDIDGTVAHNDGHRGWYEYSKVAGDSPKDNVIEVIATMVNAGYYPIFCSGRTDDCYDDTLAWLHKHMPFEVETLLMRKTGDHRQDAIIKYEIFNEHIRHNYNVVACWDDRRQVTQRWRDIGLLVNQVEFGDF